MPTTSLAELLYRGRPRLHAPRAVAEAVVAHYGGHWSPVSDDQLDALLAAGAQHMGDPATFEGLPTDCGWRLAHIYAALRQARADRAGLTVTGLSKIIRSSVDVREERLALLGVDRFATQRAESLDVFGRLLCQARPLEWERIVLGLSDGASFGTVADRIRNLRVHLGLSKAELARRTKVTHSTVVRWEEGLCSPRLAQRDSLARELGGDPDDFI
jgi:DNA-binding XRE family transcriptional regulator